MQATISGQFLFIQPRVSVCLGLGSSGISVFHAKSRKVPDEPRQTGHPNLAHYKYTDWMYTVLDARLSAEDMEIDKTQSQEHYNTISGKDKHVTRISPKTPTYSVLI